MVLFFTTTLALSVLGLLALFGLKYWELASGRMVLSGIRPHLSAWSRRCVHWVERAMPELLRTGAARSMRTVRATAHYVAAHGVLRAERTLERTLAALRRRTGPSAHTGEASAFLREVGEYKRRLMRRTGTHELPED